MSMGSAHADIQAARNRLQAQGWIGRRNESFRHLPPPGLAQWLGEPAGPASQGLAPDDESSGWTLAPLAQADAQRVQARWLNALDASQRAELLAGLPLPGDDDDAPFAWAHRTLCRRGLRLRVGAAGAGQDAPVHLRLNHQAQALADAPLLVLEVQEGVHCTLLETHAPAKHAGAAMQNLQVHVVLASGARLQHLRVVAPRPGDHLAHFVSATLDATARYHQALVATGSDYHLQRGTLQLQGAGAQAGVAGLLLTGARTIDQQVFTRLNATRTASAVDVLALASGKAHAVANTHARIAAGADDASVHQHLAGIALDGQPRMVLRPHLEILHDQVQAVHGATWGALPQDALFYASQRGLDPAAARALIVEGMARALLERSLQVDERAQGCAMLRDWLASGWLAQAIARDLADAGIAVHG